MFLKHTTTGKMVEVLSLRDLFNPQRGAVIGRYYYGQETDDPESFDKSDLAFSSDEPIPRCWTDPRYRGGEGGPAAKGQAGGQECAPGTTTAPDATATGCD